MRAPLCGTVAAVHPYNFAPLCLSHHDPFLYLKLQYPVCLPMLAHPAIYPACCPTCRCSCLSLYLLYTCSTSLLAHRRAKRM